VTQQPGLPAYDQAARFPARVWQAVENTRRDGFTQACIPEVGRLLQMLAGLRGTISACELGTAYGVGAAWIQSGLRPGSRLLTVELDFRRAASARSLFAGVDAVTAMDGDWSLALERAPFDLVFSDGGPKRAPGDPEKLLPLLRSDGLLLLDDYTPGRSDDPSRQIWFDSADYHVIELTLTPEASVLLAKKR
jgi:predicted O-methyltransferase YrrM